MVESYRPAEQPGTLRHADQRRARCRRRTLAGLAHRRPQGRLLSHRPAPAGDLRRQTSRAIARPNAVAELPAAKAAEPIEPKPDHADERGDVAAMRAYTANLGGKAACTLSAAIFIATPNSAATVPATAVLHDFYRYMIDGASHGFRRLHRSSGRRLALLVVVLAEDDRHVSRARRLLSNLRLRTQRRQSRSAITTCSSPNAPNRA